MATPGEKMGAKGRKVTTQLDTSIEETVNKLPGRVESLFLSSETVQTATRIPNNFVVQVLSFCANQGQKLPPTVRSRHRLDRLCNR